MISRAVRRVCVAVLWTLLFSVSAQAATVTLTWDRNAEPDVQGYWVSYGTASRTYSVEVNAGNNISYVLNLNPSATTTYFFAVQAYNANGRSAYSAEVTTQVSVSTPVISIDRPIQNQWITNDIYLTGWAIDQAATANSGVDMIHVYAYPATGGAPTFLGVAYYGVGRPDVAAAYGANFVNCGFALPIPNLPNGTWDIAIYVHSTVANAFNAVRVRRVTTMPAPPISNTVVQQDLPVANSVANRWLSVSGWALDLRSTTTTGVDLVQVWAFPNPGSGAAPMLLGNAQYGRSRPDVGAALGSRYTNSGFHLDVLGLQAGLYDVVTIARNTITGTVDTARVKRVTVDPFIVIAVDYPANGSTVGTSFTIGGWTIDRSATGSTSGIDTIHTYAYRVGGGAPTFVGAFTPDLPRNDVGAAYGNARWNNSGFAIPVTGLTAGTYDLVLFAHRQSTGAFENIKIVRVTVQ